MRLTRSGSDPKKTIPELTISVQGQTVHRSEAIWLKITIRLTNTLTTRRMNPREEERI